MLSFNRIFPLWTCILCVLRNKGKITIYICSHCLSNHSLLWMSLYEAEDDIMAYIEDSTLIWS